MSRANVSIFAIALCTIVVGSAMGRSHASATASNSRDAGLIPPGDAQNGAKRYAALCSGCHSLDANRIGPAHRGVVGRKAGTAPGYIYSTALGKSGIVWTEAKLDIWLQGPTKLVPGTRMGLSVPAVQDRHDIIAFLKASSAPSTPAP